MMKYDLALAFRAYPGISKQPIGNFTDKLELFKVCFYSLIKCLNGIKTKYYIILDGCDDKYSDFVKHFVKPQDLIIEQTASVGNAKTFLMQIEWLKKQPFADKVYFAEDDYVYRPNMFARMLQLMDIDQPKIHFVAPHNHGDYYRSSVYQTIGTKLLYTLDQQWHLPVSTCLTFLTSREVLQKTEKVFATYKSGNYDFSIFAALTKPGIFLFPRASLLKDVSFRKAFVKAFLYSWQQLLFGKRYVLAVAIDPIATHMQFDEMGPGVDWNKQIEDCRKELSQINLKDFNKYITA